MTAIGGSIDGRIDHSSTEDVQQGHPTQAPNRTSGGHDANSLSDHGSSTNSASGCPSDHGRSSTTNSSNGYADIEKEVNERLMADPDYVELKASLEKSKNLEDLFLLVDQYTGLCPDGQIEWGNIVALVNDHNANPAARAAAQFFFDNPKIWRAIADNGNWSKTEKAQDYVAGLKAQLKAMKEAVKTEVKAEHGLDGQANPGAVPGNQTGQTGQSGQTGQAGSSSTTATADAQQANAANEAKAKKEAAAAAIMKEAGEALPKPSPSQFSGLEGASENMNNMIGWGESEIDRLTSLMAKTDDPAVLKQLENQINNMTRRMQQMTALMNQLMTMMQNISKMYSDIAMNAVRNMR